jgi:xanthosine utilization system XapX-like protein
MESRAEVSDALALGTMAGIVHALLDRRSPTPPVIALMASTSWPLKWLPT